MAARICCNSLGSVDPRVDLMREVCKDVLGELDLENGRLFRLAMALEKMAREDRSSTPALYRVG
ncbi:hypothetical protein ACCAA_660071 [Candidatus Accumulibacter aalborgensis]|uniref:Uncharacterized protein n=1 Tax=Candidatus Accumulibacter aalborgensis TaxID=1860102 RepID=A0A1A8XVH7_9PROT|nr:hypothetical protein [Candidatus Accumulibacter aalborgensis]SBT09030.1 hypothetical protein ACCAA_660071 [Candidatus Accumulibacter aalborgensis]